MLHLTLSEPISNINDTEKALEKPSLDSALEKSATVPLRNSKELSDVCTPDINLGPLDQGLIVNSELSALETPSNQSSIANKGFCCVEGPEGLKYFLDGQPILYNPFIPSWERSPAVSTESYLRKCLKRSNGFDSDGLPFPKKFCEYKPKQNLKNVSCLSLNVALQSGLLEQDVALLLNPESKLKYHLLTLKGIQKLGAQGSDVSYGASSYSESILKKDPKKLCTRAALSKVWGQLKKVMPKEPEGAKDFPKVLCSVQFYNDYVRKRRLRRVKLRLLR